VKYIKLTQNKYAIVDDIDYKRVSLFKWHVQKDKNTFYARTNTSKKLGSQRTVRMHHFIVGFPLHNLKVDHINGNGLDNRKENLRIISNRENCQNTVKSRFGLKTSIYPGVNWMKAKKKWRAEIQINGKQIHLGLFESEEEAAYKYEEAAGEYMVAR